MIFPSTPFLKAGEMLVMDEWVNLRAAQVGDPGSRPGKQRVPGEPLVQTCQEAQKLEFCWP